jgi:hypothetical protein
MLVLYAASSLTRGVEAMANRWSAWQAREKIEHLPPITVTATANYFRAWTSPNPDYRVTIANAEGVEIGTGCYAVSPLNDRVYVFEIEIAPEHRRRRYGTAFLWHLAQAHGQPVTAVKGLFSSHDFWHTARQLADTGLVVTAQLSPSEMDAEARRWGHLEAERERLHQLIIERLYTHREPWHVAVGRGLDA